MLIPSIDLADGKAVQLRQGREKVLEREDPLALAREFNLYGEIALIDLDSALGRGHNLDLMGKIMQQADCRVGGGIRSVEKALDLINLGAHKIIIGTAAFNDEGIDHEFLQGLRNYLSRERIIIALDAWQGQIVTRGWQKETGLEIMAVIDDLEEYCGEFLFTCVEREGTMKGPDLGMIEKITKATQRKITVAGGVSTAEDIKTISQMGASVQLGMALYQGKISLKQGFIATLNWQKGLLPTIVQDEKGQVLMLAYSSPESLERTFSRGNMCYYSRSRNKLWTKGESSGFGQKLLKLRRDCDGDTILATVKQKGVACHLGAYSCFGPREFSLEELQEVIKQRFAEVEKNSYTASLTPQLVRDKVLEEAQEVTTAQEKEGLIWEAADLIYHLLVLLGQEEIKLNEVLWELKRRRKKCE